MKPHTTPETEHSRLNQDDQQLVDEFVTTGVNKVERKAFQPWRMMLWLAISIVILGAAARIIGTFFLPY